MIQVHSLHMASLPTHVRFLNNTMQVSRIITGSEVYVGRVGHGTVVACVKFSCFHFLFSVPSFVNLH